MKKLFIIIAVAVSFFSCSDQLKYEVTNKDGSKEVIFVEHRQSNIDAMLRQAKKAVKDSCTSVSLTAGDEPIYQYKK